jgi:hypothetical protein
LPRRALSAVASYLQVDVPVFVPCFNNPTYATRMVSQLRGLGFRRIVLVDGGSTYPPMRQLLAAPGEWVSVMFLPENRGPRHLCKAPSTFALLPRHFCITDPDLAFNRAMPADFLGDLAALAVRERVGKAGLALDLSDRDAMRDEAFQIGESTFRNILEWESQFWREELEPLRAGGDPVYRAFVDTTFALYDKTFLDPNRFLDAVRVAGRFTCRHLPWYRDREIPEEEERFYRSTQSFFALSGREGSGMMPAEDMPGSHSRRGSLSMRQESSLAEIEMPSGAGLLCAGPQRSRSCGRLPANKPTTKDIQ